MEYVAMLTHDTLVSSGEANVVYYNKINPAYVIAPDEKIEDFCNKYAKVYNKKISVARTKYGRSGSSRLFCDEINNDLVNKYNAFSEGIMKLKEF